MLAILAVVSVVKLFSVDQSKSSWQFVRHRHQLKAPSLFAEWSRHCHHSGDRHLSSVIYFLLLPYIYILLVISWQNVNVETGHPQHRCWSYPEQGLTSPCALSLLRLYLSGTHCPQTSHCANLSHVKTPLHTRVTLVRTSVYIWLWRYRNLSLWLFIIIKRAIKQELSLHFCISTYMRELTFS